MSKEIWEELIKGGVLDGTKFDPRMVCNRRNDGVGSCRMYQDKEHCDKCYWEDEEAIRTGGFDID